MKRSLIIIFILLLAMTACSLGAFAACDDGATYTVTFDYNYAGASPVTASVKEGEKAAKPADPTRDGYTFGGWYADAACLEPFPFDAPVRGDATAYAKWLDNSKKYYTVIYDPNYAGAEALTGSVEEGKPATRPADPVRDDAAFKGWFTAADGGAAYDFAAPVTGNITLYAKWNAVREYVFEAEYTYVDDLVGKGYSNEASGKNMIQKDVSGAVGKPGKAQASNGFYVGYLYRNGLTLTFEFTSDAATTGAKLSLRLSAELLETVSLTSDEFVVKVNGQKQSFDAIVIDKVPTDMSVREKREFQDFLIADAVGLKKGANTVTLTVDNNKAMKGAIYSTAPLVDCLKLRTDTALAWTPHEENLADYA